MAERTLIRTQGGVVDHVHILSEPNASAAPSYSEEVNELLSKTTDKGIREAIGAVNSPYTTDFQSGTEQTRNLTSITDSSGFYFNSNLTSIYVGSNVTSIGSNAFYFSTNLNDLTMSEGVTSIGSYAFYYCSGLTSVTIPNSVTSIGDSAFGFSANIASVTIPDSVTSIGSSAFMFCTSLATINCLATTAPTLGSFAFDDVATTEIHVPEGATGYGTTYGGLTVVADL